MIVVMFTTARFVEELKKVAPEDRDRVLWLRAVWFGWCRAEIASGLGLSDALQLWKDAVRSSDDPWVVEQVYRDLVNQATNV